MNNNLQVYEDPIQYDDENNQYTKDIPLIEEWGQKIKKGPIIDLACGTGRVTIPLAKQGYELIGVDIHQGMLGFANQKAKKANLSIQWIEQDCTKLHLKLKSPLIYMVGNSFQHFLTNQAQNELLTSVRKHLASGGVFIFGTRFPNAEELLPSSNKEEYWRSYIDSKTKQKVEVYTTDSYDPLTQIQTCEEKHKNDRGFQRTKAIRLRYVFPQEMERTLKHNGFNILHCYGDWDKRPLEKESHNMIYVCTPES
ncbi:class I SAM-dependent methyltransferase [Bacillus carboniphilus]|uniref:Class I SAM-dependent methyltransferase n=1 Tax=Bacillus carboniphilus TaxID=86663 RepID=A0ABY9JRZ0_9BACI|nr:class I SAM-dependent methyltransferase [Bacillus carboniphilus]WLR42175.1 class I SAM-dependent methyltransferase [Bacillus carboniphilus]